MRRPVATAPWASRGPTLGLIEGTSAPRTATRSRRTLYLQGWSMQDPRPAQLCGRALHPREPARGRSERGRRSSRSGRAARGRPSSHAAARTQAAGKRGSGLRAARPRAPGGRTCPARGKQRQQKAAEQSTPDPKGPRPPRAAVLLTS